MPDESVTTYLDLDLWCPQRGQPVLSAGIDLVDTRRLELAFRRSGPALARRLFGTGAAAVAADPAGAAGMFGVQESVVKLAGGLPAGGRLSDISFDRAGAQVTLTGAVGDWARRHGVDVVGGYRTLRPGLTVSWALALAGGAR
nr:MtcC 4'-phosphopantetheinyl transferase [uncultured bacterium]